MRSWRVLQPNWTYKFHTDDDNRAIISEHLPSLEMDEAIPVLPPKVGLLVEKTGMGRWRLQSMHERPPECISVCSPFHTVAMATRLRHVEQLTRRQAH